MKCGLDLYYYNIIYMYNRMSSPCVAVVEFGGREEHNELVVCRWKGYCLFRKEVETVEAALTSYRQ